MVRGLPVNCYTEIVHLPRLVHSSQLTVHRFLKAVNREPQTVNRKSAGFTLIELLIVISIIAILVASATYSWQNAQQKGRDGKRKSDIKAVQQALEFYYQNNGKYPDTDNSGKIKCNVGAPTIINWGSTFNCNSVNYMQQLPKDPISTNNYYFTSSGSGPNAYALFTTLENTKDPDLTNLPSCTMPSPSYNYCVVNP